MQAHLIMTFTSFFKEFLSLSFAWVWNTFSYYGKWLLRYTPSPSKRSIIIEPAHGVATEAETEVNQKELEPSEMAASQEAVQNLQSQLDTVNDGIEGVRDDHGKTKANLTNATGEIEQLKFDRDKATAEREQMKKDIAKAKAEREQMKKDIAKAKAEREQMKKDHKAEIEELRSMLQRKQEEQREQQAVKPSLSKDLVDSYTKALSPYAHLLIICLSQAAPPQRVIRKGRVYLPYMSSTTAPTNEKIVVVTATCPETSPTLPSQKTDSETTAAQQDHNRLPPQGTMVPLRENNKLVMVKLPNGIVLMVDSSSINPMQLQHMDGR
jgi:septal ring factor EnvC (AmiA/AmiB activator)